MSSLNEQVAEALGGRVARAVPLGGGDNARSFRVELDDGRTVFAKTQRDAPPGMMSTEAAGLRWLRDPDPAAVLGGVDSGAVVVPYLPDSWVRVPEVVAVSDGDDDTDNLLVLEWIAQGRPNGTTEAELGRSLAALHQAGAPAFGRDDRRTTGSRGLPNEPCETWVDFYATQRLLPLARLARDTRSLDETTIAQLERVAGRLAEVGGPPEPPARLHGDLWAGNRVVDDQGRSWLIDPAAHGGHREFDLAMMRLFGGFGRMSSPPTQRPRHWPPGGPTGWRCTRSPRSSSTPSSSAAATGTKRAAPSAPTPDDRSPARGTGGRRCRGSSCGRPARPGRRAGPSS